MPTERKVKGRPPKTTGKRTIKVDVRFSEKEIKKVLLLEATLGISRSELIRIRVLSKSKTIAINAVALLGQLDVIGAELGRVGNNINQLARYANILSNNGTLSPVVVERFHLLMETYLQKHQRMEAALRKILRSMSQPDM